MFLRARRQRTRHLLLSFVLTTIPFQIAIPLLTPTYQTIAGTFTAKLFFTIPLLASLLMLAREQNTRIFYLAREERWVTAVLLLLLVSFCNPNNYALWATGAFAWLFITCVVFARLVAANLNPTEILAGFYESFVVLCGLQAILAVCFPLLGLTSVTTLFQVGGAEWSTRNGSRPGAVGVFVHPGNLALFTMMASGFFLACYLTGQHRKLSLGLLLLNAMTIVLTYSRTSYLTVVLVLVAIYYIYHNAHKPLLSLKTLLRVVLPTTLVVGWLVFLSPLSSNFLASDAQEMFQARLDHWLIGLSIFQRAPLLGVGLNTHLEYVAHDAALSRLIHNDFLTTNPIHDIHIVVLAEAGLVGAGLWLLFLGHSIYRAKANVAAGNNVVFSLTHIGVVLCFTFYGITDWSPLSHSIFPLFLLLTFFAYKYSLAPQALARLASVGPPALVTDSLSTLATSTL
ncbi:O-antigen ligase family protein [Hymenobacter coccineus]|uniref:O-antigen ligase-related domain-containing protein n=1 Tax=Hymenobacter coccineus TaxID=1908235 RepID=A0A1G1TM27_9BACT|nr:O-antigen ligase family protein [Hymenobacter coccineus]OGX91926.1 hypothetical protein BEN49_03810 [Hymenobacter coccineus]